MDPIEQNAADAKQRLKGRKLEILKKAVDFILDFLSAMCTKKMDIGLLTFLRP